MWYAGQHAMIELCEVRAMRASNLILAWISHTPINVRDEIAYLFSIFNGFIVEVWNE